MFRGLVHLRVFGDRLYACERGSGQVLVYVYARDTKQQADIANVLTFDEARRIAVNVAKLPELAEAAREELNLT